MDTESRIIRERREKAEALKREGINPFPHTFRKNISAHAIKEAYSCLKADGRDENDSLVKIAGRIVGMRLMGKACFLHLQDESGKIQAYLKQDVLGSDAYALLKKLDAGDIVGMEGLVFKTKTGEITVEARKVVLLAKSFRPLPEKYHGLKDVEIRYRKRYLDLIANPETKEAFKKRAQIIKTIREFLDERGFIEVQTPILQPLYGGGNARPFVTKINAWNMTMYLRIAYEIYLKKLITGGFEKIYDLSYCFRNEGSDKTHNPEFFMMEIQWAYADYNDCMEITEQLWDYVAKKVLGTTRINYQGVELELKAPWPRLRLIDALKEIAGIDSEKLSDQELKGLLDKHKIVFAGKFSRGLAQALLFAELCEKDLVQPVHIIDHPIEVCPLAKPHRQNPKLAERVEPFVGGMEVGNCYTELNDPDLQRIIFEEQVQAKKRGDEEAHPMDYDFIEALEHGLPPNAGIGIGVDRMIMILTNSDSIRDIILFPTMRPEN